MKNPERLNGMRHYLADGRAKALAATAAFIMAALLLMYGAVRLLASFVARERVETPKGTNTPSPVATPAAVEAGSAAATQFVPLPAPTVQQQPIETPEASPAPSPTASPAAITAAPFAAPIPAAFSRGRMDLVLIGLDGSGKLDALALLAVRAEGCTFLFLPKNTLESAGSPFSRLSKPDDVLKALETVFPVRFEKYLTLSMEALPRGIDAAGGVSVAGETLLGEAAAAFAAPDGLDELIRVTKLSQLAAACVQKVPELGFLRLAAVRRALYGASGGNLNAEQSVLLYSALRSLGGKNCLTLLLPVDSCTENGVRYYRTDLALAGQLAVKLYSGS